MTPPSITDAARWDLSELYRDADDPALARDIAAAQRDADALGAQHRGTVATAPPAVLRALLEAYEALLTAAYRPAVYAMLRFAEDAGDASAQALLARTREALARVTTALRFLDVELKTAPAAAFDAWLAAPELANYGHYLRATRRFAPHTLSEREEAVATLKELTGTAAWVQLYDETAAAIRVPLEVDGATREYTVDEAHALRASPDRDLRARASRGIQRAYAAQSHALTFVFNTLLQDHKLETELRQYAHPMAPTLLGDEVDDAVAEALMATTEAHYPLVREYYQLKARALGLTDFGPHDLLAPLPGGERVVPFDEAQKLVTASFRSFAPEAGAVAEALFAQQRVDAFPRAGKQGGAFCAAWLPAMRPYVLTNYGARLDDVSTLAHELGHALHFVLSGRQQTLVNYGASTPLSETASVFGEMLLARHLLERETDPATRRALLALRIEDIVGTVCRQVMYTRWEQRAHARRAAGVVTAAEYCALWREGAEQLYGDAVRLGPDDHWGWLSVPHFVHSRFYCYSYAYGQLLVLALYQRYLAEGAAFVPRYLELLASGSSGTPDELLARVGIDTRDGALWAQGFGVLRALLDEFRATV